MINIFRIVLKYMYAKNVIIKGMKSSLINLELNKVSLQYQLVNILQNKSYLWKRFHKYKAKELA